MRNETQLLLSFLSPSRSLHCCVLFTDRSLILHLRIRYVIIYMAHESCSCESHLYIEERYIVSTIQRRRQEPYDLIKKVSVLFPVRRSYFSLPFTCLRTHLVWKKKKLISSFYKLSFGVISTPILFVSFTARNPNKASVTQVSFLYVYGLSIKSPPNISNGVSVEIGGL